MRRLYLQIYLGFIAVTALLLAVALLSDWLLWTYRTPPRPLVAMARRIAADLPPGNAPAVRVQRRISELARELDLEATVWSPDGATIASVGKKLPSPRPTRSEAQWLGPRGAPSLAIRLADGRWLGLALRPSDSRNHRRWTLGLLVFAGIVALGALPVSRRITRRLERLRAGVEMLGAGELTARVAVEGRDEVADLARSFNHAAERIEHLVGSQRRLLASASHELRTPLARLRVAVELLSKNAAPDLKNEASADIAELDELIEDLLLAARLESAPRRSTHEPVDLLALLVEEAARTGARADGEPVVVSGDPRLLRRLVRNLLDNARRYGGGSTIEATVGRAAGGGARLEVADRGAGVPESERERIFEAFYRPAGHSEGRDGGVGLGLALVREIARHHGGEAVCLPRPGGGTLFRVDL